MIWLQFVASLVIVLFAGTKAARYADIIATRSGLGRIWIGLLLLAVMTSMPELVTGISSVTLQGVEGPDLGLGTLLGSCIFNLSILVVLDVLSRRRPFLNRVSRRLMVTAGVAVLLAAIVGGTILAGENLSGLVLGPVGITTAVVFALYLLAAWGLSRLERSRHPVVARVKPTEGDSTLVVSVKFAAVALAVIGAGMWLSYIGDGIVEVTGWRSSFVGSLLLAITTSMPELVVAITAFRLGAYDLAVADILGANILDISYVFILDLLYREGPILASVSSSHAITTVVIAAMSIVVIVGLRFRQKRKTFFIFSWYSVALLGLYLYGAYALFTSGIGS